MPLRLLKGIRHFKNNHFEDKKEMFTALSKGQAPDVLFFGCIDSRVDLRSVTNANPGELLVDRNPGNIITPYSSTPSGEASSIEFALSHLNVDEIIICGHSHCGAMTGLMSPDLNETLPSTAAWLSHAKPALDHLHENHPELKDNPSLTLQCLTQDNILLQIKHLKTHPVVTSRLAEGKLKIHGWYYEFETGEIYIYHARKNSFISFEETVAEIAEEKLNRIVKTEALDYLNELTPIQNPEHYNHLLKSYRGPNEAALIWDHIETKVMSKAREELGELYLTSDGYLSAQFDELLTKGPLVQVTNTQNKYQQIKLLFDKTLEHQSNPLISDEQKNILAAVSRLKQHTLTQFAMRDQQFNFENCEILAETTQELINKLMQNKATSSDVAQFSTVSQPFSVGTSLIGGMWAKQINPVKEVTDAAKKIAYSCDDAENTRTPDKDTLSASLMNT